MNNLNYTFKIDLEQIEPWQQYYAQLAQRAMLAEVNLTPKPGLVDRSNNGAHSDMTLADFYASANAITQYLPTFIKYGCSTAHLPAQQVLLGIRPIGIDCEQAMYKATNNINTHKGTIFSLGLLYTALGRLKTNQSAFTAQQLCQQVSIFCQGIIDNELKSNNTAHTAGQKLYLKYGLTGARGEAESRFDTVLSVSLPVYQAYLNKGMSDQAALHQALLALMAINNDTNVVARGDIAGLRWLQTYANRLLKAGGVNCKDYIQQLKLMDQQCIDKNLSPGGCADLLILTWLLHRL